MLSIGGFAITLVCENVLKGSIKKSHRYHSFFTFDWRNFNLTLVADKKLADARVESHQFLGKQPTAYFLAMCPIKLA